MAEVRKILGQSALAITTITAVYTVPALTQAVVSSIVICNVSAVATTFRISLAVAGLADTPKQYLYYNVALPANDTFIATIGVTLGAGDIIRAYSTGANTSVNVFGVEITA
jgi:hypothetical protein